MACPRSWNGYSIPSWITFCSFLPFRILNLYILHAGGRTARTGDQLCRKAAAYTENQTYRMNADKHTFRQRYSNPTIPAFVQVKTFHVSKSANSVIGLFAIWDYISDPCLHIRISDCKRSHSVWVQTWVRSRECCYVCLWNGILGGGGLFRSV
jgi:hypothetical protein